jgi:hypothetical protein
MMKSEDITGFICFRVNLLPTLIYIAADARTCRFDKVP